MIKFFVRILLNALVFKCVFPLLPGLSFQADWIIACAVGLFFCIVLVLIELIATFVSTIWTLSTFGLALLIVIPLRLIFFWWLFPALSVYIIGYLFPSVLNIGNFFSAGIAALMLTVVALLTRDRQH